MAIKRCDPCKPHDFQDQKYGQNMRVYTEGKKSTCTVCGKQTEGSETKKK